jgi:signal transduction histidine kinase
MVGKLEKRKFKAFSLLFLSILFFILSQVSPLSFVKIYRLNRERILVKKVEKAKLKFERLIDEIERREDILLKNLMDKKLESSEIIGKIRNFLKEDEGVIIINGKGKVELWFGRVFNPFDKIPERRIFIVQDLKSHFLSLVSSLENKDKKIVFVKNLENKILVKGVAVRFVSWKERDKLEKEYVNKGGYSFSKREEKLEVFSPFIIPEEGMLAIFMASSLSENYIKIFWRDLFLMISYLLIFCSFILISIFSKGYSRYVILVLLPFSFRAFLLLTKKLIFFRNFKLFKPEFSSLSSKTELLNSPLDIFLTVLTIFWLLVILTKFWFPFLEKSIKNGKTFKYLIPVVFLTPFPIVIFQAFLQSVVHNTSKGLFYFLSPFPLFMILVIFIASLSSLILSFILFSSFYLSTKKLWLKLFLVIIQIPLSYFLFKKFVSVPLIPSVAFFLISSVISYHFTWVKKGSNMLILLIMVSLFLYFSLDHFLFISRRSFIENDLKNIILAQERWSEFILREGIKDIESHIKEIEEFLLSPKDEGIAYKIWLKTTAAKLRWPSAIEILDRDGEVQSSFSLNLPIPESIFTPFTERWWVEEAFLPFFDKVKRVKFGYKGILAGKEWLGKIIFYISSDYDAIPILYRESPYYSILKGEVFPPSPVMEKDFGFAVFDEDGSIIFNPSKIPSALGRRVLDRINNEGKFWSSINLPLGLHHIFYFKSAERIFSIFYPVKGIKGYSLEIMEIIIISLLYLSLLIPPLYLSGIFKPDWLSKMTFSTKVRIIFLTMAILPFIIFSMFSNFFLQKLFIEQMKNKAIGELETAKGIFAQFYSIERENIIPQDLILWVGNLIARDINIYLDGVIIGSSRWEVFLSQYLPYHLDGEIYYEIVHKRSFYYLKRERIGKLLYFTLSSPMKLGEYTYIVSIPLIPEVKELGLIGREFMEFLSIMFFFFALGAFFVSQSLYKKIIGPIKTLLGAYRDVGKGNLDIRLETKSKDEIRELMEGFNSMVKELKSKQEELKEMERRQAWAEMAKKAAHEIKNPLTPILLMTEHLLKIFKEDRKEFEKHFERGVNFIINEVKRLKRISSEFLTYSQEKLERENFDLKKLVEEITEPLKVTLKDKVMIKVYSNKEDIYFYGDMKMIETVLRNILLNAIEAIEEKGEIGIELIKEEGTVKIVITDSGKGISQENLSRIFEPYFTTKPSGTGLGLSIAKKLIELHGGKISVNSELEKGTKVTIELPT